MTASRPASHLPQRNIPHILTLITNAPLLLHPSLRPHLPARHRKATPRPRPLRPNLLLPRLHIPLMHLPTPIPQTTQYQHRHQPNPHRRPPRQHPPQPLHLALLLGPEHHADLVIDLRDLAVAVLALHADVHAAVVEHAAEVVFEREGLLRDALGEDVGGVLEVGELGAGVGRGGFAGVEDFGAELGAGGAEEVGFLFGGV